MGHPELSFETFFSLLKLLGLCLFSLTVPFSHVFRRTNSWPLTGRSYLFTSNYGICLLVWLICTLSPPSKPLADSSVLRGAETADDVFTPVCHSCLHQAGDGDGLASCKGRCACLFPLWHMCPLIVYWSPRCILQTEFSRKWPFFLCL